MATGASTADAAVLLIDVRKRLMEQTRRHLLLARLLGVRHAVVFVNKMDLVGYSQAIFEGVRDEVTAFATPLGFETLEVLPGSALRGDMVVGRGAALDWFSGPTLLERLESLDSGVEQAAVGPFRLPVQLVSRPQGEAARGYLGRIESGVIATGDEVQILPSGRRTRVREIRKHDGLLNAAAAGDSVTLVLADDIDVARGDLIAGVERAPREARALDATLVWLAAERALSRSAGEPPHARPRAGGARAPERPYARRAATGCRGAGQRYRALAHRPAGAVFHRQL